MIIDTFFCWHIDRSATYMFVIAENLIIVVFNQSPNHSTSLVSSVMTVSAKWCRPRDGAASRCLRLLAVKQFNRTQNVMNIFVEKERKETVNECIDFGCHGTFAGFFHKNRYCQLTQVIIRWMVSSPPTLWSSLPMSSPAFLVLSEV